MPTDHTLVQPFNNQEVSPVDILLEQAVKDAQRSPVNTVSHSWSRKFNVQSIWPIE